MATLHDTALGTDDASASTLSCADTLTVTAGDLVFAEGKFEGATTSITFDTGAATPTFTVANAVAAHANNDLHKASAAWIATSTGTVTVRYVLGAARLWKTIRAYSVTPGASKTLSATATAVNSATGTGGSASLATGSASATGAGVSFAGYVLYGSRTLTASGGWGEAAEFDISSAHCTSYQLHSGAGSLSGAGTLNSDVEYVGQIAIFDEADAGGSMIDDSANEWNPLEAQTNPLLIGVW